MKWVYIPALFMLAFIYTKTSYNNLSPYEEVNTSTGIARGPSSQNEVSTKSLKASRFPASIIYKNLQTEESTLFAPLKSYRGAVVGNLNVENFGYLIDDNQKAFLGIRDFNDVTEGALYHDVLSHLVSAKIYDKKISWMNYFEFYKNGLLNKPHRFSFYSEKGIEETFTEAKRTIEKNITSNPPIEFIKTGKKNHLVDAKINNRIQNQLRKIYPKIQFFDLKQTNNDKRSYNVLVRIRPIDQIQWLIVKDLTHSEYDFVFNKESHIAFKERFEFLRTHIYSNRMNNSLGYFSLNKKYYSVRFADQYAARIKWEEIPEEDYRDQLMDQAYQLGQIHRLSVNDEVENYIKAWATIPSAAIDEKAVDVKFKLVDLSK